MLINTFYFSNSDLCGISIFNRHLRKALSRIGLDVLDTNLRTATEVVRAPIEILHYAPGSYASPDASAALIQLLSSQRHSQKLCVVIHGLHSYGESRFSHGNTYPQNEEHIRLMLQAAESICALSSSAARACRTWQSQLGGDSRLHTLNHPGLFQPTLTTSWIDAGYALLAGISRTKKINSSGPIITLLDRCRHQGVRVLEHWTNVRFSAPTDRSWKQTYGFASDMAWSNLVSNARVVLCPYQTRVQAVSGVMSEAISAGRFVLSTSFDLALEMQEQYPTRVFLEDNLKLWPQLINQLPHTNGPVVTAIPSWDSFASSLASELSGSRSVTGRQEPEFNWQQTLLEHEQLACHSTGAY